MYQMSRFECRLQDAVMQRESSPRSFSKSVSQESVMSTARKALELNQVIRPLLQGPYSFIA
jgi:hypothetical protein